MPKKIDLSGNNNPNLTITVPQLQALVDRYKNERYNRLVPSHIQSDGRAVWLSKNAVEKFLHDNPGSTGVRLYFGVIDDMNHANGCHNLVVMATDKVGTDNVDRAGSGDTVIVTETFTMPLVGDAEGAHCPPPTNPCGGNTLSY